MWTPAPVTPVTFSDILGTVQGLGFFAAISIGVVLFLAVLMYKRFRK